MAEMSIIGEILAGVGTAILLIIILLIVVPPISDYMKRKGR